MSEFKVGDICNYSVGNGAFKVKIIDLASVFYPAPCQYLCIVLSNGSSTVIYEHHLTLANDLTPFEKALYE